MMAIYEPAREYAITNPSTGDNYSYGFEDDFFATPGNFSEAEKIMVGIVCLFMITIVLFGNTLVVVAVSTFRHLRTPSNLLLLNLAVADITVATLVMTFSLGKLLNNGVWFAGELMCKLWMSLDVLCCTASILNLCVISLDKYWAITKPLSYKTVMSKRRTIVMISSVWILSSVISFVPIFSNLHADKEHAKKVAVESCSVNFVVNQYYAIVSAATSFYLPSAVMLFTYCRIYIIAHSQIKRIMSETPRDLQGSAKKRVRTLAKEVKAVRTLGVIMGCFILCWLPFFLMYIIMNFCSTCSIEPKAEDAITWLGYANSMINPFIYNLRHVEFKRAFRAILTCRRLRSLNREASLAANSQSDLWATNSRRNSLRKLSNGSGNVIMNGHGGYWTGLALNGSRSTSPDGNGNARCMSVIKETSTPSISQDNVNEQHEHQTLVKEFIEIPHLQVDEEVACEEDV